MGAQLPGGAKYHQMEDAGFYMVEATDFIQRSDWEGAINLYNAAILLW